MIGKEMLDVPNMASGIAGCGSCAMRGLFWTIWLVLVLYDVALTGCFRVRMQYTEKS